MPEFERIKENYNREPMSEIRYVSDAEASRRFPSDYKDPNEIVEPRGDYNSLDGTHPHTQAEADARDAAYLRQFQPKGKSK